MTVPDLYRQLGELSARRAFLWRQAAATPEAKAYHATRVCADHEPGNRTLRRQAGQLRAAADATPEAGAAAEADAAYLRFVADHQAELDAARSPAPAPDTSDQWLEQRRALEAEVERTAPLVPDPGSPVPWDHQLALDDLQAFEVLYPDPEAEIEL